MTTEGVDFSDSRPGGAALVAAGKTFVVRYVPYGGYQKGLTAAEIADYQAHGLAIALVWESTANRALSGKTAGVSDARTAQAAAAALGFPDTTAIYFAVDFDVSDAQLPAIDAYLAGASMILGAVRVGVYGGRRVVAHCKAAGIRWLWQTFAWSYGTVVAGIHLYQYHNGQTINGASLDLDRAMQADYGQWNAPPQGGIAGGIDVGMSLRVPSPANHGTVHIPIGTPIRRVADGTVDKCSATVDRLGYAVDALNAQFGLSAHGYAVDLVKNDLYFVAASAAGVSFDPATLPPAPDTTPFAQADLDAAKAAGTTAGFAAAKAKAVAAVEAIG
jgi:Domain of unknown function (DUF1906)